MLLTLAIWIPIVAGAAVLATGANEGGSRHADQVDAAVIVEALILDGDDRLHEVRRDARQRHFDPLLAENRERRLVVNVEQQRRLRHRADAADRGLVRETRDHAPEEPR